MQRGIRRRRRGLPRPGEDTFHSALLRPQSLVLQLPCQAGDSQIQDSLRGSRVPRDRECHSTQPQIFETLSVPGHDQMQVLADLRTQRGGLLDEVAAMARQQTQSTGGLVQRQLEPQVAAWTSFCQTLFQSGQFRYVY
jgi:hypothetical protein